MDGAILLPQQHQRDAWLLQLQRQFRPVRFGQPALPLSDPGSGEQPVLKRIVSQVARQRPTQPRHFRALQIILHGTARYAQPLRDLAAARTVAGKPQHLSQLSHGQPSLCRHCPSLVQKDRHAKVADPGGVSSAHQSGRILIGIVAGFMSERWPASGWNTWPDYVGIRRQGFYAPRRHANWPKSYRPRSGVPAISC